MICRWLMAAVILISNKAASQDRGFESREISFRPPGTAVSLEIFAAHETFVLERNCVAGGMDVFDSRHRMEANTLEFGLRVLLPQRIPAQSQWYSRYTCLRPGEKP